MLPPSTIGVSWPWCVVATYDDEFSGSVSFALSSINQDHIVLRKKQLEVLQSVNGDHDVFAWFPTGYGKSLCYQLLPYMFDVKLGLTKAAPSERSVVLVNFSSSERRILPPLYSAVYYGCVYIQNILRKISGNHCACAQVPLQCVPGLLPFFGGLGTRLGFALNKNVEQVEKSFL